LSNSHYGTSGDPKNAWKLKQVATQPDGHTRTLYTNAGGKMIPDCAKAAHKGIRGRGRR
jgi:hypothetical protein